MQMYNSNPYANQYMNPYMNYQQPYPAPQNPQYPDRMNMQMQPQMSGKVVDSIDVVKATDIPMDGNMYYFPKADGSEIYVKSWQANGTTRILTFKPCFDGDQTNANLDANRPEIVALDKLTMGIMNRFDSIDDRFDKIEKSLVKNTTSRTKKESDAE